MRNYFLFQNNAGGVEAALLFAAFLVCYWVWRHQPKNFPWLWFFSAAGLRAAAGIFVSPVLLAITSILGFVWPDMTHGFVPDLLWRALLTVPALALLDERCLRLIPDAPKIPGTPSAVYGRLLGLELLIWLTCLGDQAVLGYLSEGGRLVWGPLQSPVATVAIVMALLAAARMIERPLFLRFFLALIVFPVPIFLLLPLAVAASNSDHGTWFIIFAVLFFPTHCYAYTRWQHEFFPNWTGGKKSAGIVIFSVALFLFLAALCLLANFRMRF